LLNLKNLANSQRVDVQKKGRLEFREHKKQFAFSTNHHFSKSPTLTSLGLCKNNVSKYTAIFMSFTKQPFEYPD